MLIKINLNKMCRYSYYQNIKGEISVIDNKLELQKKIIINNNKIQEYIKYERYEWCSELLNENSVIEKKLLEYDNK